MIIRVFGLLFVVAQSKLQPTAEVKSKALPSGFKEVRRSGQILVISQEDLPWLGQQSLAVSLAEITLVGGGEKFLYGSAIYGKDLVDAAGQLDEQRSTVANQLFYSHLPEFIRKGCHPYIKGVDSRLTDRPIYNVYNRGGQRVYFMRFDRLQGLPVIIRIAVCDKAREIQVLGVITGSSHKTIKKSSKL